MQESVELWDVPGGWVGPWFEGAAAGALRVGVDGLLQRLELELGLPPPPSWADRVLTLASEEFHQADDPFGAAASSLRLADALCAEGARTEALPARWRRSLGGAMAVAGALDDRAARVCGAALGALRPRPVTLHFQRVPGAVRPLFAALERSGWTLAPAPPPPPPMADVVTVVGRTTAAVAEAVVLAALPHRDVVWVAPDRGLERAITARGGPALGLRGATDVGVAGRVLALAFEPQHPQDALDFLAADAPVPPAVRRTLAEALREWPSWRGAFWAKACAAADVGPEAASAVAWVRSVLTPLAGPDGRAGVDALRDRFRALAERTAETATGPAGARLAERAVALLGRLRVDALARGEAEGLLRFAAASVDDEPGDVAQSGAFVLPSPAAVTAPVDHLVLWNAAAPPPDPFEAILPAERAHLARAGVVLPDRASRVAAWSRDVLRAVARARRRVWVCLPACDARGEAVDDPPWRRELPPSAGTFLPPTVAAPRLAPPRAVARWRVDPARLGAHRESPSSAARRLGCPLTDALRRDAELPEPALPALPAGALLRGRVAHAAFEALWRTAGDGGDPEAVSAAAREAVERVVAADAATLELPSARGERAHLVRVVVRAATVLARSLRASGARVVGTEVALGGGLSLAGARWYGRADVVTGPAPTVVDLKWSPGPHRAALAQGTALQPALYAWMLRGRNDLADDDWPSVAYLVATTGALFGSSPAALDGVDAVRGPSPAVTVRAAARALARRAEERASGELHAPGAGDAAVRDAVVDGALTLAPPCGYCAHAALCGRGGAP